MTMLSVEDHAVLMDRIYRYQRHIYDATRRFYLLGRNELIEALNPPAGGNVLEIGCGTGRNLVHAAQRYPGATFHGFDISRQMLASARLAATWAREPGRILLAEGDAASFDAIDAFGVPGFERVYASYAISMIPNWRRALRHAARLVAPGGQLHVVDFGDQADLPPAFRKVLYWWLKQFHVTPRVTLEEELCRIAGERGAALDFMHLYRGYAALARLQF